MPHSNIAPALKRLAVPVGDLTPHPENARNGDVEAIARGLVAHGQYAPVVVQESTGRILKGNHVYAAALSLGWDQIAATRIDVDDDQALRILVWDNRASELGVTDDAQLAALLQTLDDLEATGYGEGDLARILARLDKQAAEPLGEDTRGLGSTPVVSYALIFDTLDQQNRWYAFLKWLRGAVPGDTIGERLDVFLSEVLAARQDGDA